jgi:hypothetical protein
MAYVGIGASGKTFIGTGSGTQFASIGTNCGLTVHGVVIAEGNGAFTATAAGTANQVLTSNGALLDPTFQSLPTTVVTINGDSGSITGSTVTIYADHAAVNSGSSVKFVNSGTTSTLNVTDASSNTLIGNLAGNLTLSGSGNSGVGVGTLAGLTSANGNTAMGELAGSAVTTGVQNCLFGNSAMYQATTSANNVGIGVNTLATLSTSVGQNTAIGNLSLGNINTGAYNIGLGYSSGSSYTSTESSNIVIGNSGTASDAHVIRIGAQGAGNSQQNECFIAGIVGVTASNAEYVTINSSTGQLGVATIPAAITGTTTQYDVIVGTGTNTVGSVGPGSAGQVLQSGGAAANPAYSTATYPSVGTSTGSLLRADGTNWSATTSTYPTTNAVSTLLYASAANVMNALATGNNGVLITSATGVPSILADGTTGQVLTATTGSPPAWANAASSGFTKVTVQVFTGHGTYTYTPTSGMKYCTIEVCGAGGGGGGGTPGSNLYAVGAGGGGGGYGRKTVAAATIGSSQTVTIGTGGTAGSSGTGGTGGTSSLGAIVTATGGAGGTQENGNNVSFLACVGGAGGAGASGDFNTNGAPGGVGISMATGSNIVSGNGGSSFFGGGAVGIYTQSNTAGNAGSSYGGGGSGSGSFGVSGSTGGAGADGIVVITEFS